MKQALIRALMGALLCGAAATAKDQPAARATSTTGGDIERGAYLVGGIGLCGDCHTPRNAEGHPVMAAWLQGASVDIRPTVPIPNWAETAPPLAGLPTYPGNEEAIRFLMTGIKPDGTMARPPMPPYRLDRKDAEDVVAYLRSLARPGS